MIELFLRFRLVDFSLRFQQEPYKVDSHFLGSSTIHRETPLMNNVRQKQRSECNVNLRSYCQGLNNPLNYLSHGASRNTRLAVCSNQVDALAVIGQQEKSAIFEKLSYPF